MKGIVTICGSTKFRKEFEAVNAILTLKGYVVLTVGSFGHQIKQEKLKDFIFSKKNILDPLHKDKITMSECILVININGYIGESTYTEIQHAKDNKMPVIYLLSELDSQCAILFDDHDRQVYQMFMSE